MSSVDPTAIETQTFDWGIIKWLVSPDLTPGANITFGQVVLLPGEGHTRHNHPLSEEILYVLSGVGEQMVDDKPGFAGACRRHHLHPDGHLSFDRQHRLGTAGAAGHLQSRRRRARAEGSAGFQGGAGRARRPG